MPLPLATQQRVGQVMQVFPAFSLLIIAPTGGNQMQMGMVVTIASMCMGHHDVAASERLAPDLAKEVIQALHTASHQRTQQERGVVVEGGAEHARYCQDDMSIDHPLVEDLAHLADPVVDVDFGTTQAQRRFTAHRYQMFPLYTLQAAVFDGTHLFRVATRQHFGHQGIIVGRLVAWMGVLKLVPVIGKDLLEDAPVPRGLCHHRVAPSWGVGMAAVKRFYHGSPASSTPHRSSPGHPHPPLLSLSDGDFRGLENAFSYTIEINSNDRARRASQ